MAKIGDGVPRIIDKTVDFMASSQAFMEYLKKCPRLQRIPRDIPEDKKALFLSRLEYYRQLYRPTCDQQERSQSVDFWKAFFKLIREISSVRDNTIVERTICW